MEQLENFEQTTFSDLIKDMNETIVEDVQETNGNVYAPKQSTEALISERHQTHGDYADTARCAQRLKDVLKIELYRRHDRGQPKLTNTQIESLDLICTKIARIVSGEAGNPEHWNDIAGYAKIARADA